MSVNHIVLLNLDESAGVEQLQKLYAEFQTRLSTIPGVESVSIGKNFKIDADKYNHAAAIRLVNREALENYIPHPTHIGVAETMKPYMRDYLVVDYDIC